MSNVLPGEEDNYESSIVVPAAYTGETLEIFANISVQAQSLTFQGKESVEAKTSSTANPSPSVGTIIKPVVKALSFESSEMGMASVEFVLKDAEEIVFHNLPVGSTYQITEEAGDYYASYSIVNEGIGGSIVKSSNQNSIKNTMLTTALETVEENEEVVITYSNRHEDFADIKLKKNVVEPLVETKYSHTSNINDAGVKSGNYGNN